MKLRGAPIVLLLTALGSAGWLDSERSRVVEGNRLLEAGKASEAVQRYGEALVDNPDSPLLNYNMGNAHYQAGQYSEALASYGLVRAGEEDSEQLARVAYNAGNAQYRLAAALESEKPQDALKGYAQALVAYRRALGADHTDNDAKFNYELVTRKIEELKKKLEEQKKEQEQKDQEKQEQEKQEQEQSEQQEQQQDQQQQDQSQDQQDGEQQPSPEEANQSQEPEEDQKPQPAPQEQEEAAQPEEPGDTDQQAGGTGSAGESDEDRSRQEAAALLDNAKAEELSPEDFARQMQGATVVDPTQDW